MGKYVARTVRKVYVFWLSGFKSAGDWTHSTPSTTPEMPHADYLLHYAT